MSTGFIAACLAKHALQCPPELPCVAVACCNLCPPEMHEFTLYGFIPIGEDILYRSFTVSGNNIAPYMSEDFSNVLIVHMRRYRRAQMD